MAMTSQPQPELRTEYSNTSTTAPSETFTLTLPLPALARFSSPPTAYLRALRTAIKDTQLQINEALTSRMEDDKQRDAEAAVVEAGTKSGKASNKRKKGKVEIDEEAEEQNYGEEIVEED